ncbi:MAG TPA: 4-hydroxyphenylacetate 3-hydroxylase N-terminal domain-containing protein [Dehalococcoidia bacterium]|nr:4-hydroxyphenylacetate 3-hydroxylase N-terminal domain-containing protein [Dehalococcoidia bacterium]
MKTAKQYIESLSKLNTRLYLLGKKVEDWVNDPIIRPSINAVAMTYKVEGEPENQHLSTAISNLTGKRVNKFNAIFQSTDELVTKIKLQRMLGQRTACCFQRCVGMDGINAVYSTTYEIDQKHGTEYHKRFKEWLIYVQENDLCVAGCMTDVKGNRGIAPSDQADADMFVHVVERRKDGIVIKGAKASQTGAANSHEQLIMPTMRMREADKDYAVSCAIPTDAEGVTLIYGRQPCDTRKLEPGDIDVGNYSFGGQETLTIFDNVFVPWDRVFMCGEYDFSIMLVERFAAYHRQSYGGCKPGVGDVLIGAAAAMADYNGTRKAAHIKDKLAEMIHLTETMHACGLACSYEGYKTAAGNYQSNILLSNICKLNVTRIPYELCRLSEDIAGGLLVTLPAAVDLKHPEIGPYVDKYLKGVADVPTEHRFRMLTLIHAMVYGLTAPSYRTESMHGAGSPQAQKIMIERETNMGLKQKFARTISGVDKREDIYS